MNPIYQTWIADYIAHHNSQVRGLCGSAAHEMAERFPELTAVRGWVTDPKHAHYFDDSPGSFENGHWWCVTATGEIIDPTAAQFSGSDLAYVPYDETKHGPMPVGKCPNCGWLIMPDENAGGVHKACVKEFEAYLIRGVG